MLKLINTQNKFGVLNIILYLCQRNFNQLKKYKIMTAQEIKDLPSNKIRTISIKVGAFANSMQFKVMKENNNIIVVTREGLLKYFGNAQHSYYSGVKNKHYKIFKTAISASKFINKNLTN